MNAPDVFVDRIIPLICMEGQGFDRVTEKDTRLFKSCKIRGSYAAFLN